MGWEQLAPQTITRLSTDLSISPQVAAGIVGQLGYESAGLQSINEMQPVVPESRGGFGWAQWTGPRRRQFESWAEQNKMDVADPEANYQFLLHELTQTPEKGVLKKLEGVTDPKEAGRIFTNTFLRPGVPAQDKRDSWVEKSLNFILPTAQAGTLANTPNEPQYSQEELQQALQQATAANDTEAITELQEMMATQSRTMPVTQAPQYSQEELQQALQQATAANDVEAIAELEAMLGSAISPPEKAQLPQERNITDEAFNTDPTWINNAKTLFKEVEGSDFKGNDADAADWLKNYVAQTNWSLTGAGTTFYDVANKLSPQGKQALLQSLEEYDQAPTSMESVGRAAKGLIFDPANVVGLGAGTLLTKTLGKKALSKGLQEALKQGIAKGAGTKVGSALTSQGAKVAAGGAAFAGADEALRQGIQVGAGGQEEYDIGGIATSSALGGAGGLGASKLINRLTGRTDVRKFGARAGSEKVAKLDAEIAQDYQKLSENPIFKISGDEDASKIQTELKNELKKAYVKDVENALRVVDPKLLKQIDVKNILSKTKTAAPDQLAQISTSPEGKVLANAIEKYQRATALTAPSPANQGIGSKLKRAGLQYAPKITAGIIGASTLGPLGFLLGPLAQGVSAGTAQGLTGKKTVPEVIQALSSGRGLKAAQNVSKLLGPSDASITAEKLLERTRRAQQSQAALNATKKAQQQTGQAQKAIAREAADALRKRNQQLGVRSKPGFTPENLQITGGTRGTLQYYGRLKDSKELAKGLRIIEQTDPYLKPFITSIKQNKQVPNKDILLGLTDRLNLLREQGILSPFMKAK